MFMIQRVKQAEKGVVGGREESCTDRWVFLMEMSRQKWGQAPLM